jgi:hypothetical protein
VLAGYDEEARYFEDTVRHAKQEELVKRAQHLVRGAFNEQLSHLQRKALDAVVADLAKQEAQQSFAASAARCAAVSATTLTS